MFKTTPEQNKALVLEAFDTLFNRRDYAAAERYWSERRAQHNLMDHPISRPPDSDSTAAVGSLMRPQRYRQQQFAQIIPAGIVIGQNRSTTTVSKQFAQITQPQTAQSFIMRKLDPAPGPC
jgi:hypothetical protein